MNFCIEMLPAQEGDCLWIEYGPPRQLHRILIDGGRGATSVEILKRIQQTNEEKVHFELIVITHVDLDHIGGILKLLQMQERPFTFGDIWFNGWRHLEESDREAFGPIDGEKLTSILVNQHLPWNQAFEHHAIAVPQDGEDNPRISLTGGMELTIISPSRAKLLKLKPKWEKVCENAGIVPNVEPLEEPPPGFERLGPIDIDRLAASDFKPDKTEANGSSIVFAAEFDNKRALFGADSHPDLLLKGINYIKNSADKLHLDVFKLPHHGSKANISKEILEAIECNRYLVSTSGARFKHPDPEAIARIIKFGGSCPELIFNYRSDYSKIWDNKVWMRQHGYSVRYLDDSNENKRLVL